MRIKFKYSKNGEPDKVLWNKGWKVSYGFKILGFHFLKYYHPHLIKTN